MAVMYIPRDPRYSKNFKGMISGDSVGPCIVCGKLIKAPGKYFVHMMDGGDSICTADEDDKVDPGGDLGFQPIGTDCLRRYPELRPFVRK